MDVQHALLSKIILHAGLNKVVDARITTAFFTDDHYRRVYEYLLSHWQEYGVPPDASVVAQAFPAMTWEDHPQPVEYFVDRLRERRKKAILTDGLNQSAQWLKGDDPDSTVMMERAMRDAISSAFLETAPSLDLDITMRTDDIWDRLMDRRENPGHLRGISTGFQGIDYVTGGLQPEQFVVLTGTIKSFKSATALAIAMFVHRQAKVPLFIGFEMSNTEQEDRLVSLLSHVSLTRIMNGTISTPEERKIDRAMKLVKDMRAFFLSTDITSAMTVSGVQAKVQQYDPDVVVIDGAYLMQSELSGVIPQSPQALTDISRSLKRLAQSSKKPIIATTQSSLRRSKGGLTADSLMYTQAWGQDCDVLLGTERTGERQVDETTQGPVQVKLRVIESRSGPRKEVILEWDWDEGSVEELDPMVMASRLSAPPDTGTGEWDD